MDHTCELPSEFTISRCLSMNITVTHNQVVLICYLLHQYKIFATVDKWILNTSIKSTVELSLCLLCFCQCLCHDNNTLKNVTALTLDLCSSFYECLFWRQGILLSLLSNVCVSMPALASFISKMKTQRLGIFINKLLALRRAGSELF